MSLIYLNLALASSLSIALLLRMFENQNANRNIIIASNYISAGTLAYLLSRKPPTDPVVYYFAAVLGLLFFIAFILFSKAVKSKGIASTVTIGRISLAIPVAFSIFLWGETPNLPDIIALVLILFIILAWEGKIGKISPILITLFLLFGFIDSCMKYFKLKFSTMDDGFFLIGVFLSAMVWGWLYVLSTRQKVGTADIGRGLLLGIPNFGSSYFLLKSLESIEAYVVFPYVNVGIIIFSALFGFLLFKEKLDKRRILLLFLGVIAVLLLTI